MFGLGFWETIVILVVALVMIKPEKLPGFFRRVGQLVGKAQQAYETLRRAVTQLDQRGPFPPSFGPEVRSVKTPPEDKGKHRDAGEWHPDGSLPYPELRGRVRRSKPKSRKRKQKNP